MCSTMLHYVTSREKKHFHFLTEYHTTTGHFTFHRTMEKHWPEGEIPPPKLKPQTSLVSGGGECVWGAWEEVCVCGEGVGRVVGEQE